MDDEPYAIVIRWNEIGCSFGTFLKNNLYKIIKKYPSYEEIIEKYEEVNSWEKVAKHFGITRKIIQRLRKLNE
jgi:cell fate (sporulation/competence/biofilm development) regulator YlbF (YheA/YmcA/DUF963 family)